MEIILGGLIALISSLSTRLIDRCIREHGRTTTYVISWEISFTNRITDSQQEIVTKKINSVDEINRIAYSLVIGFYNNSEVPVVISDSSLEFIGKTQNIIKFPKADSEIRVIGDDSYNQNVIIDLPAKRMTRVNFEGEFYDENDFKGIYESSEVYYIAVRNNGKKIRKRISGLALH